MKKVEFMEDLSERWFLRGYPKNKQQQVQLTFLTHSVCPVKNSILKLVTLYYTFGFKAFRFIV